MEAKKFNQFTKMAQATVYSEPEVGNFHTKLIPDMVKAFFLPLKLNLGSYILDVGCGQGTFIDLMKDLGYTNTIGITLSADDFAACGEKRHTAIQCDMSDMTVPDNIVDFIWCRQAIEHSPYPLFTLYEFNRVLKIGGKAYIEVPAQDCARKFEFNPNHYSILGETMWASLFEKAGFKVEQSAYFEFELKADEGIIPEKYICFTIEKHATLIQDRAEAAN
jgi:ubiquinone/menaquinone biosynthesis C-methylase UbiE